MAEAHLDYAEPVMEPYAEELVRRLRKVIISQRYEAEHGYAANYRNEDGSYVNPLAERCRLMADLLESVVGELIRLNNKVNHG